MASQINLEPTLLDLKLYAGDGITLKLTCKDPSGAPVDITGEVQAQIRLDRLSSDPPIVEFTVGLVDAYLGILMLSLTGEQTQDLVVDPSGIKSKFTGVWDVEWTPVDLEPRTICQGIVECVADVTR